MLACNGAANRRRKINTETQRDRGRMREMIFVSVFFRVIWDTHRVR